MNLPDFMLELREAHSDYHAQVDAAAENLLERVAKAVTSFAGDGLTDRAMETVGENSSSKARKSPA